MERLLVSVLGGATLYFLLGQIDRRAKNPHSVAVIERQLVKGSYPACFEQCGLAQQMWDDMIDDGTDPAALIAAGYSQVFCFERDLLTPASADKRREFEAMSDVEAVKKAMDAFDQVKGALEKASAPQRYLESHERIVNIHIPRIKEYLDKFRVARD